MRRGKRFYLGTYESRVLAARVYDNAIFYLGRAGFVLTPALNFPDDYRDPDKRPEANWRTKELIERLELQRAINEETARADFTPRTRCGNPVRAGRKGEL
jgi:hypothetical protein